MGEANMRPLPVTDPTDTKRTHCNPKTRKSHPPPPRRPLPTPTPPPQRQRLTNPKREDSSSSATTTTTVASTSTEMSQTSTSTSVSTSFGNLNMAEGSLGLKLTSSQPPTDAQMYQQQITTAFLKASSSTSPPSPMSRSSCTYSSPSSTFSPAKWTNGMPALTAELPIIGALQQALQPIALATTSLESQVAWIRDVLHLVSRACAPSPSSTTSEATSGPAIIDEPALAELAEAAVNLLLVITPNAVTPGTKVGSVMAEALYHRASLASSGAFPALIAQNPRVAFRTFEAAARAGYHAAWFRLGRDYEAFNDAKRAKSIFERGAKAGDVSCLYRLGMAHLMGQLGLPPSSASAVPLLHRAAEASNINVPQPSYVYALLMLDDFANSVTNIPKEMFEPYVPAGSTVELEAQKCLERSAFLHFAPAQYKIGHSYEFARPPFAYDPLLSVQYYTLASSAGEPEADLALSKWFLCGAEDVFEKDESLAFVFADRAARVGLPSAEFAIGYYWEVGIGTGMDLRKARKWYTRAANQGNQDAIERLSTLTLTPSASISRHDHSRLAEQTLVRRRTQAKARSDAAGSIKRVGPRDEAEQVVTVARRASRMERPRRRERESRRLSGAAGQYEQLPGSRRQSGTLLRAQASDVRLQNQIAGQRQSGGQMEEVQPYELPPLAFERTGSNESISQALAPPGVELQQFSEHKRYSLVDHGPSTRATSPSPLRSEVVSVSRGPQGFTGTPRGPGGQRNVSPNGSGNGGGGSGQGSPAVYPLDAPPACAQTTQPPKVRYTTFEEMGIQPKKQQGEKDCIIM